MRSRFALAAAVALVTATPSWAALITVTYHGKITEGYDGYYGGEALFSDAGGYFGGEDITATFVFDSALGTLSTANLPYHQRLDSSPITGNPIVSATVTINGITTDVRAPQNGLVRRYAREQGATLDQVYHSTFGDFTSGGIARHNGLAAYVESTVGDIVESPDITAPVTYLVGASDRAGGNFITYGGYHPETYSYDYYSFGLFSIKSVTIGVVPEPASWIMMIGGFGLVGGAMRLRRLQAATA